MAKKGGMNMPKGRTDFMIVDNVAHFWADNKEDLKTMLNMQMVNLALGGFKIKCHDVSDVKPAIFGGEEE
tara:strand:+ start:345 stop:554 length:210 start_codon:yes stop_codon:yes gene_type:complete